MSTKTDLKLFPFSLTHLIKFRRELKKAGSFEALMVQKQALGREMGMKYIKMFNDIEEYKRKHLVGVYATLRPMYDTEMPYVFWSELHRMLLKREAKKKK